MGNSGHDKRKHAGFFLSCVFMAVLGMGGDVKTSEGFLGIKWGDEATAAAKRLGLTCSAWEKWEGNRGYETCFDIDHPVDAFGRQAYARLFRAQNRAEGLSLRFMRCSSTRDALTAAIRQEFHLEASPLPLYSTFPDGSVVHFGYDGGDDTCQLTVAGPRFGKSFAEYLLETGFKNFNLGSR